MDAFDDVDHPRDREDVDGPGSLVLSRLPGEQARERVRAGHMRHEPDRPEPAFDPVTLLLGVDDLVRAGSASPGRILVEPGGELEHGREAGRSPKRFEELLRGRHAAEGERPQPGRPKQVGRRDVHLADQPVIVGEPGAGRNCRSRPQPLEREERGRASGFGNHTDPNVGAGSSHGLDELGPEERARQPGIGALNSIPTPGQLAIEVLAPDYADHHGQKRLTMAEERSMKSSWPE